MNKKSESCFVWMLKWKQVRRASWTVKNWPECTSKKARSSHDFSFSGKNVPNFSRQMELGHVFLNRWTEFILPNDPSLLCLQSVSDWVCCYFDWKLQESLYKKKEDWIKFYNQRRPVAFLLICPLSTRWSQDVPMFLFVQGRQSNNSFTKRLASSSIELSQHDSLQKSLWNNYVFFNYPCGAHKAQGSRNSRQF